MQLTTTAQKLKELKSEGVEYDDFPEDVKTLSTCMGSEEFSYALYDGGYLKPEDWIEGDDLIKLRDAINVVGEFKDIVNSLHEEF